MKKEIHVWETYEICLRAEKEYENPYMDVIVWAVLEGPGYCRKVYGFWNGGRDFRIRVTATRPGIWKYRTDSNVADNGLKDIEGAYIAKPWSE